MNKSTSNMVERIYWTFDFTAEQMLAAAQAKVLWHAGRQSYWETENKTAEEAFRAAGVTLEGTEEEVAMMVTSASYGNQVGGVKIDAKLQKAWVFAQGKLREHAAKKAEFQQWAGLFQRDVTALSLRTFALTKDDVEFFGLIPRSTDA